jgi:hypothetical protein
LNLALPVCRKEAGSQEKRGAVMREGFLARMARRLDAASIAATKGASRKHHERFHDAMGDGNVEILRYMLEAGFDPNQKCPFIFNDGTFLHGAVVTKAKPEVLDLLLAHGADPHLTNSALWLFGPEASDVNGKPLARKTYQGLTPRELAERLNLPDIAARLKRAEDPTKLPSLEDRYLPSICETFFKGTKGPKPRP